MDAALGVQVQGIGGQDVVWGNDHGCPSGAKSPAVTAGSEANAVAPKANESKIFENRHKGRFPRGIRPFSMRCALFVHQGKVNKRRKGE